VWLFANEAVADPAFDPSFAVDFWDMTNRQDWTAVESVQRGIDSCRVEPGVFAANEDAVYHFATMVAAAYHGRPPAAGRIGAARPTAGTVRRTD
jgi:Rieske 2Fe-2S family protein